MTQQQLPWKWYLKYLMSSVWGNKLHSAAIIDFHRATLAKSPDFPQATAEQLGTIIEELHNPGTKIRGTFQLGNETYTMIQGEPGVIIRGKQDNDAGGVTIYKTNQAVMIGIYKRPMTAWQANTLVEWIADYVIRNGH